MGRRRIVPPIMPLRSPHIAIRFEILFWEEGKIPVSTLLSIYWCKINTENY